MKTREEKAAELYNSGRDSVMYGGGALERLASHLNFVVNGTKDYGPGLWKARAFTDQTIELDSFEDYLLKPAREGLEIPDLAWLLDVLEAHPNKAERNKAIQAVVQEIPDFLERAGAEKRGRQIREVEAAGRHGGTGANQHTKKSSRVGNSESAKQKRSNKDPERILARLKRDAAEDHQAADLLKQVETGDIKPRRAALEMGWIKPTRSIPIDTPEASIKALLRVFTREQLLEALTA